MSVMNKQLKRFIKKQKLRHHLAMLRCIGREIQQSNPGLKISISKKGRINIEPAVFELLWKTDNMQP